MSDNPPTVDLPAGAKVLKGNDVVSLMIDVWLCGFVSGGSSALGSVAPSASEEACDGIAQRLAEGITRDPLAVEAVRQQVIEILSDVDTGPQQVTVTIPGGRDRQ